MGKMDWKHIWRFIVDWEKTLRTKLAHVFVKVHDEIVGMVNKLWLLSSKVVVEGEVASRRNRHCT